MKVVYIAMLCLIVGCKKKQQTIKPILQTITQSVYASGTIKSNNQYKVFTTVSGIIETVLVAENDEVSKGTPLFLIANELQQLQEKNAELTYNFNTINFNKGKLQDAQSLINVANKKMKNDALMVERLQNLWNEGIGKKVEFKGFDKTITGDELMLLDDESLKSCVMEKSIFTRMFPEAKLKIINALKANHQIVAMTGDGVNDGPALKAAHIGIAMGKKGTEIAKQAASLILLEDDLSKMVDAVAMGRKIYTNLNTHTHTHV